MRLTDQEQQGAAGASRAAMPPPLRRRKVLPSPTRRGVGAALGGICALLLTAGSAASAPGGAGANANADQPGIPVDHSTALALDTQLRNWLKGMSGLGTPIDVLPLVIYPDGGSFRFELAFGPGAEAPMLNGKFAPGDQGSWNVTDVHLPSQGHWDFTPPPSALPGSPQAALSIGYSLRKSLIEMGIDPLLAGPSSANVALAGFEAVFQSQQAATLVRTDALAWKGQLVPRGDGRLDLKTHLLGDGFAQVSKFGPMLAGIYFRHGESTQTVSALNWKSVAAIASGARGLLASFATPQDGAGMPGGGDPSNGKADTSTMGGAMTGEKPAAGLAPPASGQVPVLLQPVAPGGQPGAPALPNGEAASVPSQSLPRPMAMGPSVLSDAQRMLIGGMFDALGDLAAGFKDEQKIDGLRYVFGGTEIDLAHARITTQGDVLQHSISGSIDVAFDGLSMPGSSAAHNDLPTHLALRPYFSGIPMELLPALKTAVLAEPKPNFDTLPLILLAHGGLRFGIDPVEIDLGEAKLRGNVQMLAQSKDALQIEARFIVAGLDAFTDRLKSTGRLTGDAAKFYAQLRRLAQNTSQGPSWNISWKMGGRVMINGTAADTLTQGVDVAALVSGLAQQLPAQMTH